MCPNAALGAIEALQNSTILVSEVVRNIPWQEIDEYQKGKRLLVQSGSSHYN